MKYPEYKNPDWAAIASDVQSFWKANNIFERSVSEREGAPSFTFYEGPPSANGTPGIHHVMARAVKDIFCRYKTQKGFQVKRKAGWDTHGLPVELQVEKELGITKEDIGKKITVEEYNRRCRETVMKFTDIWNQLTEQMGYWVDLSDPYVTYEAAYVETLWQLLKRLYDKGLLYKGYTIQPYSPAAGTGLSSHELNQPGTYKMVKDTTIVAQFKVVKDEASQKLFSTNEEQVYFLAWTTTPWTLPANTGLAVGKDIVYKKVRTFNQYTGQAISVILAEALLSKYFNPKNAELKLEDFKVGDKNIPYQVEEVAYKGLDLQGCRYEQLMPYITPEGDAFRVVVGDFVSTEDGTGIVHLAPTFGGDDFRVAKQKGLPALMVLRDGKEMPIVDRTGKFVEEIEDFAGLYVKNYNNADESDPNYRSTDVLISIKLKEENKAFKVEKYEHTYPHCWRTDKPVLYYPLESWFVKTTALKDRLVELNKTINWKPESTGTGRFGNWLENLVDWNLSRSRFWGTPLPIWQSEDATEETCIGSMEELKAGLLAANASGFLNEEQISENQEFVTQIDNQTADLHRPYVDRLYLIKNGKVLFRQPDLIDVWFDSGAMPYAQWHYPFENQDVFEKNFPADFIAEGVDQTRGWFFTLHALSVMLFDSVAFKNVIANGLVLDKDGNKMSKRLGNAIDPFKTMDTYGPDATRWYMVVNAPPWDNLKFNLEGVAEVQRKFFGTLFNTYSFFALYANLDGFNYSEPDIEISKRAESDQWILSRLNSLILKVDEAYSTYEPTRAAREIQEFVNEELSNWYVRLNRKRFWKGEYNEDKISAFQTLYTCLKTVAKIIAPVSPFFAEKLFRDLNLVSQKETEDSVHLANFPVVDSALLNSELERKMELAQQVCSMVHAIRKKHSLKVRQPLKSLIVPAPKKAVQEDMEAMKELILSEVNIKALNFIEDDGSLVVKKIKPDFKKLGKALGPKIKELGGALAQVSQQQIRELETVGSLEIMLANEPFTITVEDVEILNEDVPGWIVASEKGLTIALDLAIDDELIKEGLAREIVNRLQNARKDKGLEVQDKIKLTYLQPQDPIMVGTFSTYGSYIAQETQIVSYNPLKTQTAAIELMELNLDGYTLQVAIDVESRGLN